LKNLVEEKEEESATSCLAIFVPALMKKKLSSPLRIAVLKSLKTTGITTEASSLSRQQQGHSKH